jgi:hypothetical protein
MPAEDRANLTHSANTKRLAQPGVTAVRLARGWSYGARMDKRQRRGWRVALCAATVGVALAMGAGGAAARCTQAGNATFCVHDDGTFDTTIRMGNTTIVDQSDGYHTSTTEAGGNTYMIDNSGNSTATYRSGGHTFDTGSNANGDTWSRVTDRAGADTFRNGQINGQPWTETTQWMGKTTVWSGINTNGTPWSETAQRLGGYTVMSGIGPNGVAWPQQKQPEPVGGNGMTVFTDGGNYVPPLPIQVFCPIC